MAEDRETVRAVSWQELFPFLQLFAALRIALGFRMLVLAAVALVGTAAGWRVLGEMFDGSEDPALLAQIKANAAWPWDAPLVITPPAQLLSGETWRHESPLVTAWNTISLPFVQIYRADVSLVQWTYWLCCALWSLAVWAFFGGVITRSAAVGFARQENLGWGPVAGFVRSRWGSYFAAPLAPILVTFAGAVFMGLLGWAMRTEVGLLAAGIVWPLVLLGGFTMAFLLIGLFFSWPLMWATISAEGTDMFGALSHAYSYVCQRPLRYLLYAVLAAALGVLGWLLVGTFVQWILALASWGVSWGSGVERITEVSNQSDLGPLGNAGVGLITFWGDCLKMLAFGFVFSYFWVASTVIYFLLRRLVDATELDEVWLPEEQELRGLPPLKTGADGVVEPADDVPDENHADKA